MQSLLKINDLKHNPWLGRQAYESTSFGILGDAESSNDFQWWV